MAFPWTLQRYIFREMGKTFLLTALALTATMSLGGGVLQMMDMGQVTPRQLVWIMALLMLGSAALTLPIAVLFSAAATYGRLSADNEFVACRSGGINLHVLLLPTIVLSLISAAITFGFSNFLIPGLTRNLDEFVSRDLAALVGQRLDRPQGLKLGSNVRLTADGIEADPHNPDRIVLRNVVFVEMDGEEWSRYGTAEALQIEIDLDTTPPAASARMFRVSFYDRKAHRFVDLEEQAMPRTAVPVMLARDIKYLNLPSLLYYAKHPDEWYRVEDEMRDLRVAVARRLTLDALEADLRDDGMLTLTDQRFEVTVRSDSAPARIPRDGGFELQAVNIEERRDGRLRVATADRAVIEVPRSGTVEECRVAIQAYDVRIRVDGQSITRTKETFGPVDIPSSLAGRVKKYAAAELMTFSMSTDERDPVVLQQRRARFMRDRVLYDVIATINERAAFSVSVFVLALLAASLGIVFRGAHTIVAFGIAFIPSLFVMVMILAGKQLTENIATHATGLCVLWGGIVLVGGLDVWTLKHVLRR